MTELGNWLDHGILQMKCHCAKSFSFNQWQYNYYQLRVFFVWLRVLICELLAARHQAFSKVLAARKENLITARARKK